MSNKNARARNYKYIRDIKINGECLLCLAKENLTFHHRNPLKKRDNVTNLAKKPISLNGVKAEIEKCDLLCEDCHKFIHEKNSGNLKKYNRFIQYLKNKAKI